MPSIQQGHRPSKGLYKASRSIGGNFETCMSKPEFFSTFRAVNLQFSPVELGDLVPFVRFSIGLVQGQQVHRGNFRDLHVEA